MVWQHYCNMEEATMKLEEPNHYARKPGRRVLRAFSSNRYSTRPENSNCSREDDDDDQLFQQEGDNHLVQVQYASNVSNLTGRERLKRHREEIAGRVVIPDSWGQENLLKDWIDYSSFDKLLSPNGLASARQALAAEGRIPPTSRRLRIQII